MLNADLTIKQAPANVRSGMKSIQVVPLAKGTKLFRFGNASGPWWILESGYYLIAKQALQHKSELSLMERISDRQTAMAFATRQHLAVLHEWNKFDHLVKGEVASDIMVFMGAGRPQEDVTPTGFRLRYQCAEVPQIYVPNLGKLSNAIKIVGSTKLGSGRNLW